MKCLRLRRRQRPLGVWPITRIDRSTWRAVAMIRLAKSLFWTLLESEVTRR